jgi:hypothetical protein
MLQAAANMQQEHLMLQATSLASAVHGILAVLCLAASFACLTSMLTLAGLWHCCYVLLLHVQLHDAVHVHMHVHGSAGAPLHGVTGGIASTASSSCFGSCGKCPDDTVRQHGHHDIMMRWSSQAFKAAHRYTVLLCIARCAQADHRHQITQGYSRPNLRRISACGCIGNLCSHNFPCSSTGLAVMLYQSMRLYFSQNAIDHSSKIAAKGAASCTAPSKVLSHSSLNSIHHMAQPQQTVAWFDGIASRLWPSRLPLQLQSNFRETRAR